MPLIPNELIERIKAEVPLTLLAERRGVALKKAGNELKGRCPFHDDKTPSLQIDPVKNIWHCLGACQKGGSPIDWMMHAEGIPFRRAVDLLLAEFFPSVARESAVPHECPLTLDANPEQLLEECTRYYHERLKVRPEGMNYLGERGLDSSGLVDRFELGYCDRSLGLLLPPADRKAGEELRKKLQETGILLESGHERFRGSLVIPIRGEDGRVCGMYGRKTRNDLRKGTPKHLYLPRPLAGVFNLAVFAVFKVLILCESLIDALSFYRYGHENVTSSFGADGFTDEIFETMRKHGTERVLIAYDQDEAGNKGARSVSERLVAEGIECFRILFPKGMDANEYVLKVKPAELSLDVLVKSAEWMGNGSRPPLTHVNVINPGPPSAASLSSAASPAAPSVASPPALPEASFPEENETTEDAGNAVATAEDPARAAEGKEHGIAAEGESSQRVNADLSAVSSSYTSRPVTSPALSPPVVSPKFLSPGQEAFFESALEAKKREEEAASAASFNEKELDEFRLSFGDRSYRVRGLRKSLSYASIRVNVKVERPSELFSGTPLGGSFTDTFDLCIARPRGMFEKQAAQELGVTEAQIRQDLGHVLQKAEDLQDKAIKKTFEPKVKAVVLTQQETEEADELVRSANLVDRIAEDLEACGLVGERKNKIVACIATVSRKLDRPLAVMVQSSSAAGKSALMEAVLSFVPEEEKEEFTALTANALFYLGETSLRHKVLAIAEEQGAERASYALKLLQSQGKLKVASTGKDSQTGRLETHFYKVEGPTMIFQTTAAAEMDEELQNRCLLLTVDEDREQTRAIQRYQREQETIEGYLKNLEREGIRKRQQNAQRLLKPVPVTNPYARELTFLDDQTRTRRDHQKYLTLIRAITLLYQYQRPVKKVTYKNQVIEYLEVSLEDIAMANGLAGDVLGHSLDELLPQTRKLLMLIEQMVRTVCEEHGLTREEYRFTRKDVRAFTHWGDTQLKIHMNRLSDLEYLLVHRGDRGNSFVYELLYAGEGKDGSKFLPGLIDVEALKARYDADRAGTKVERAGLGRPAVGPQPGGGRTEQTESEPAQEKESSRSEAKPAENAHTPLPKKPKSYALKPFVPAVKPGIRINLLSFPPNKTMRPLSKAS